MPIRINLLAEQLATEELRRRDPVKRVTWVVGFGVGLLVVWSAYLQFKLMGVSREMHHVETQWKKLEPEYNKVATNLNKIADAERKWAALHNLASNRFLLGTLLNALQYTMVDSVQLVRFKTDQNFLVTEGVKPTTNTVGVVSRGKPSTSRQRIVLTIEAKDYSTRPGDQISKFQESINNQPYFRTNLQKTELMGRSPPQPDAGGRQFVSFTIDCQFPEKLR